MFIISGMWQSLIFWTLAAGTAQSTYKISQQFFTNSFTNNDFSPWTITSSSTPLIGFTTCGNSRIFGGTFHSNAGYNVFIGDAATPTQISRLWLNLIPHYSVTITAKIYKIDSWPNSTIFVMADGTTAALFTFNSSNPGSSDICGNPNPIPDSVNTNYNDSIVTLNVTINHSSATLNLTFVSNLMGAAGAWGIRQLNLTMQACDESCETCSNGSACATCNTANGLVLSGAYCLCSSLLLKRQKSVPCSVAPCVACVALTCLAGYPSSVTSYCQPCNVACSGCSDPTNSVSSCSGCAAGFTGAPSSGVVCASCFSGCATCSSTAAFACSSCKYQYFYYAANSSCLSACPAGYYGVQKTATCYSCVSPCATCIGAGVIGYFCLSCISTYYLWNYTCSTVCPISTYAYSGTCYSVCPTTTFANVSSYTCVPCGANCAECNSTTTCTKCISNAYLQSSQCYTSCLVQYYGDATSGLCLACDSSCQTCSGPASNQCLSCVSTSVLLNSTCYSSCPAVSYSNLCLPCDSSCLTCDGPSSTDCFSCSSPNFYHLNFSSCIGSCNKGEVSNNYNMTCYSCQAGMVSYFQVCTPCHSTCLTCNGISFFQCVSCDSQSSLYQTTCVSTSNSRIISSPSVTTSMTSSLSALLITYLVLSLLSQFIFQYKTNLLPVLQMLQILAYTYYLTLPLSQNTQQSMLMLYLVNLSALIKPLEVDASGSLPIKFGLIGKTGYYLADCLGPNIIMLVVILIHVAAKCLSKRFNVISLFYKKINPYLVSYTFRLVFMELALNLVLYIYCFDLHSTVGVLSLVLAIIDVCGILIALLCWKCVTEFDGQQTALLYNNEIGEQTQNNQSSYLQNEQVEVQAKIRKNQILPSALGLCSKIPIPLTLLLFVGNGQTQVICLTVYSALYITMSVIVPYRRRIYRWTIVITSIALLLNYVACVGVLLGGSSSLIQIVWVLLLTVALFLTIMQIIANYKYVCACFGYVFCNAWRGLQKVMSSEQKQQRNEESQSNMTVDVQENDGQLHKNIFEKEKSNKTHEQSESKQISMSKARSKHFTSYLHLSHNNYNSQNDVKLDLNL